MAGLGDVALNFARGFSLGSSMDGKEKRLKLAEEANTRAQEEHDAQMWRQKQAQDFMNATETYSTTRDPNAMLEYAKTYHPEIFPSANANYSVAKDENGNNVLNMTDADGNTQPVSTPQGQPLTFNDEDMQRVLIAHLHPDALTQEMNARLAARGKVAAAQALAGGAENASPGIKSALGFNSQSLINTGAGFVPVTTDNSTGTMTAGQPVASAQLPPALHAVNQGDQTTFVQTGGNLDSPQALGSFSTNLSPGQRAEMDLARSKFTAEIPGRQLDLLKKQQDFLQQKIKASAEAMDGILKQYGGNSMDLNIVDALNGGASNDILSGLGKKGFDKLSNAAKTDPTAQKLLDAYNQHLQDLLGYSSTLKTIGMTSQGTNSSSALSGGLGTSASPITSGALAQALPTAYGTTPADISTASQGQPSVSPTSGKQLDAATAKQYLAKAGGDITKARELAKQDGWAF